MFVSYVKRLYNQNRNYIVKVNRALENVTTRKWRDSDKNKKKTKNTIQQHGEAEETEIIRKQRELEAILDEEMPEEHLKKINQGENNPFYGKNHTEEVKEDHSIRISGANHPMWGKKHDEETIQKIKQNRNAAVDKEKMIQLSKDINSKSVLQMTLDGHFIAEFSSIKEASIQTGCSESIIGKCCRGVIKKPRNFLFKFKDSESLELKNSFSLKIGDDFESGGKKYELVKRNKCSAIGKNENQLYTFRKKEYPELFKKVVLEYQ